MSQGSTSNKIMKPPCGALANKELGQQAATHWTLTAQWIPLLGCLGRTSPVSAESSAPQLNLAFSLGLSQVQRTK